MIAQEQRTAVHRLAQSISTARTELDKQAIRRHAEGIYNIASRNEARLTEKIDTRWRSVRNVHAACPNRMRWIQQRMDFKLIKDDCKLIVEILEGIS